VDCGGEYGGYFLFEWRGIKSLRPHGGNGAPPGRGARAAAALARGAGVLRFVVVITRQPAPSTSPMDALTGEKSGRPGVPGTRDGVPGNGRGSAGLPC